MSVQPQPALWDKRLGVVKPDDAEPLARGLQTAIRRPDLWRLAPNPLRLTVMALIHTHKGRLPNARALLYEDTVDILLWRCEQLKQASESESVGLRQLLVDTGRSDVDLKRTLWRLAFEAHQTGGAKDGLADIAGFTLEKALAELHPAKSRDWAKEVIEAAKHRAGLLLERLPEVYAFPHRTFQEYLAGAHLASQAAFAREAAKLVAAGACWREAILLAVGKLVYLHGDMDKPLALVGELCPHHGANANTARSLRWNGRQPATSSPVSATRAWKSCRARSTTWGKRNSATCRRARSSWATKAARTPRSRKATGSRASR